MGRMNEMAQIQETTRKNKRYTYEFKKRMVELYYEGESAQELAEKYDIPNRRRVQEWVQIVRENGYESLQYGKPKSNNHKDSAVKQSLQKENARLKLENEYLKKLVKLKRG